MTEEQKQSLANDLTAYIGQPLNNPMTRSQWMEIAKIALDALTAQPDDWKQRAEGAEAKLDLVREQRDSELNRNTELEAKLAELEKQEPVAWLVLNSTEGYVERNPDVVAFLEAAGLTKCKPLFNRPAPAINLAELVPDKWHFQLSIAIPNLDNMTPYQAHGAAWEQCRAAMLRNIEEAQ